MADKKQETVQLSESAVVKALMTKRGQFAAAAKKKRPTGLMTDAEILERLGIGPGESKVFSANVNNIKPYYAKNDASRLAFNFAYSINSDDKQANGVTVRNNYILEATERKTVEEVIDELMYELQGLGEDTESYKDPMNDAVKAMTKHTKDKTDVRVTVKHWVSKDQTKAGMNVTVNPVLGNEDLPTGETSATEELVEEGTEGEAFNPDDWIGVQIKYSFEGDGDEYPEGDYILTVKSYDEGTECFICEDETGAVWEGDYAVNVYEGVYEAV